MDMQARVVVSGILLAAFCSACAAGAQSGQTGSSGSELQQHYDAAQSFQQAGKLEEAGQQYRLFISDALSELAFGEAHLGEYMKAASLFDSALALEPDSLSVRMGYAQAALDSGALPHAETLARQILQERLSDFKALAQAHEILGRTLLRMNRDQDARKELEAAYALDPSFDHGYNLAVVCLDLDDAACATRIFSALEAAYGDTPAIHMDFGRAWGESDFQPRAEEEFRKVIAEDPRFPEAHYCLAATYLQENESTKLEAAETELKNELTVSPKDFLTYAALGKLAAMQQRYAAAERYLQRAIQLNPKNPDAYLYLGQMYFDTSRPPNAETALREAIRLTTDPSRNRYQIQKAHYLLGRILMKQGKQQEAAAEMKIAQAFLQHNFVQDKNKLTGLLGTATQGMGGGSESSLALGDTTAQPRAAADPAAVRRLEEYRKQITPAVADSYNNLGDIAAVNKDYSTAVSYFQSAAAWNPSLEGLDLNWGRAAFSASDFGDAIAPLTRYLHAHPNDRNIRAVLGISQFMVQDYRGCLATLQPVESEMESIPQIAYVYADSLVKTGQTGPGIERLVTLEKRNPGVPDVHRALGEAYAGGLEKQKAVEELRIAIRLDPRNPRAHRELGEALLAEGDAKGAILELESAIQLAPGDPDAHRELARAYRTDTRQADADREMQTYESLRRQAGPGKTDAPLSENRPSASPKPN